MGSRRTTASRRLPSTAARSPGRSTGRYSRSPTAGQRRGAIRLTMRASIFWGGLPSTWACSSIWPGPTASPARRSTASSTHSRPMASRPQGTSLSISRRMRTTKTSSPRRYMRRTGAAHPWCWAFWGLREATRSLPADMPAIRMATSFAGCSWGGRDMPTPGTSSRPSRRSALWMRRSR